MAVYVYRCRSCDAADVEVSHSISEDPDVTCDECGASRSRVPQLASTVLKGSGFYRNDGRSVQVGDPDRGIPPATPKEFGGTLDTGKRR